MNNDVISSYQVRQISRCDNTEASPATWMHIGALVPRIRVRDVTVRMGRPVCEWDRVTGRPGQAGQCAANVQPREGRV